jgi:hypothetical protein
MVCCDILYCLEAAMASPEDYPPTSTRDGKKSGDTRCLSWRTRQLLRQEGGSWCHSLALSTGYAFR